MSAVPMFDPDSPDVLILEAFEKVRQMRTANTAALTRDDAPDDGPFDDDEVIKLEGIVEGDFATTIPAIIAQLQLSIIASDQSLFVESTLLQRGWRPLLEAAEANELDGCTGGQVVILNEMIHLDWEQKLLAYERATNFCTRICEAQDSIDQALQELDVDGIDTGAVFDPLVALFSGDPEVRALMKTVAPDFSAFNLKGEIVAKEALQGEAWPWMLRDARFLMGNLDADPTLPKKEAA